MTKITRAFQKVFCDDVSEVDNIAQFGSLKASAPAFSKDPDTIQGLGAFGEGWKSAVMDNKSPPLQDMNALFFLLTRQMAYSFQAGIAEYDADTEYHEHSYCQDAGVIYRSKQNSNNNHAVSDGTWWDAVFKPAVGGGALGDVPVGAVIATMSHLSGAYNCTATTSADDKGYVQCNGQTLADVTSPMNGAAIPNINNDVFLMGHTTSGTASGSNTKDISHTHSVLSNVSVGNHASHTHTIDHTHTLSHTHSLSTSGWANIRVGLTGDSRLYFTVIDVNIADVAGQTEWRTSAANTGSGPFSSPLYTGVALGGSTDGASASTTSAPSSASSGGESATLSHSVINNTVTSSSSGSAAFDIRPKYITAKYVMRVK